MPSRSNPGRARSSRREEICGVAERLFYERGYSATTLRDVTDVLGLTAPAVYRHFSGKQDLLLAVLDSALDSVEAALIADPDDPSVELPLSEALVALARAAVARPDVWELAERDARYLEPDDRERISQRIRSVARWLRDRIAAARPDLQPATSALLARAVMAMYTMPSAYAARLPNEVVVDLLVSSARLALAIPEAELRPTRLLEAPAGSATEATSRREQVLRGAGRLFSQRGYESVSMTDIGDAVGLTGPSIYYYFDSKSEILTSIFRRGLEWLALDRAQHPADTDAEALVVLLEAYARLALSWPEIFRLFVNEQVILQHLDHGSVVSSYREFVQGGVALLRAVRPELTAPTARALLGCAMSVLNDLAITETGQDRREAATALVAVAAAMIELERIRSVSVERGSREGRA